MLTFNLKKEWFEKIKSGEKTHEYRVKNYYWFHRLFRYWYDYKNNLPFLKGDDVCFCLGYPSKSDTDKRLYGKIKAVTIINGKHTDVAIDKDVYDIEFELIKDN